MACDRVYLGFDIGTSSVRCLAVSKKGQVIGSECAPLDINHYHNDYFEQSSHQIWTATCNVAKKLLQNANINAKNVHGIGFDATCSLVVLDNKDNGVNISKEPKSSGDGKWDIVMWMDHRATAQAEIINRTRDEALKQVGGSVSPEMELPKLMWIKEHLPATWRDAAHFMDLADFMTYKTTAALTRSQCTVVCKWLYKASENEHRWNADFFHKIGLGSLLDNNAHKIGSKVQHAGERCGTLTDTAAAQMGLRAGTTVATGIIDAHAGVIGTLACKNQGKETSMGEILTMICGTSTCHMTLSRNPVQVNGIWGPYYGSILPAWSNEAGQSAVGSVLDSILMPYKHSTGQTVPQMHQALCRQYEQYKNEHGVDKAAKLAENVDVWPDYHGNRSPLANAAIKGALMGLSLDLHQTDTYPLPLYVAHVHAMAYMTRFIVQKLEAHGYKFSTIHMCGGLQKNPIYVQCHADILGLEVVVAECHEPVALGAAVLGAAASGHFDSLAKAMSILAPKARTVQPCVETKAYHDKKYERFLKLGTFMQELYPQSL